MNSSSTQCICDTCSLPYLGDDAADSHMNPPDDYRFGYQRYCLACWLGVGPKDDPDLFGDAAQPVHPRNPKAEHVSGDCIGLKRPQAKKEIRQNTDPLRPPLQSSVYLWLCCEGWIKFGPFEWLRFDDEHLAILGPDGADVAKKVNGQWRVPGEKWQGWGFSNPTITTTPLHPHKDCGRLRV